MADDLTLFLVGLLVAVLGWIGARVQSKLDELNHTVAERFDETNRTLASIERDLRGDLTNLDRRVTRLEAGNGH
ncbi:MAG: hypothetical protein ACRCVK_03920 [Aeromonas veronii]